MQEEQKEQTRKRRSYTAAEFAEVWDRWGRGESSKKIARVMDRGPSVYTAAVALRRHPPANALPLASGVDVGRAGGGLPRPCLWAVAATDRPQAESCAIDPEPRGPPQRRFEPLSGGRGGQAGLEASTSSEALSVATLSSATPTGRREAARGLGSAADCRLAETDVSGQRVTLRVTRNDLSQSFHPGPRGFEERTDPVSAFQAHDSALRAGQPQGPRRRTDPGSDLD